MSDCLVRTTELTISLELIAQFDDGTVKRYDVSQLFSKHDVFKTFRTNPGLFSKARIDTGGYGVVWNEDIDLSANEIWANGTEIQTDFNGLMAFSDASSIWNLNESTLRKALSYGKLKAGVDCCKYGKQWVITTEAMYREYGNPKKKEKKNEDFSWDNQCAAEKETPYSPD